MLLYYTKQLPMEMRTTPLMAYYCLLQILHGRTMRLNRLLFIARHALRSNCTLLIAVLPLLGGCESASDQLSSDRTRILHDDECESASDQFSFDTTRVLLDDGVLSVTTMWILERPAFAAEVGWAPSDAQSGKALIVQILDSDDCTSTEAVFRKIHCPRVMIPATRSYRIGGTNLADTRDLTWSIPRGNGIIRIGLRPVEANYDIVVVAITADQETRLAAIPNNGGVRLFRIAALPEMYGMIRIAYSPQ